MKHDQLNLLTDATVVTELKQLVKSEREILADVIRYLQEVDRRKIFLGLGFSSLFTFCTRALGYSEGAAWRRIKATRSSVVTPVLLEKLEAGTLSLCAVTELARVPKEVRQELIPLCEGLAKVEVQKLVAPHVPVAYLKSERVTVSCQKLEESKTLPLFAEEPTLLETKPVQYTVTVTLTEEEFQLLENVRELSKSSTRGESVVQALKFYKKAKCPVAREERRTQKQDITATVKTQSDNKEDRTRYIPDAIRDQVHVRDYGRCTFVSPDGTVCGEQSFVQVDHIKPYSHGGEHTVDNLRILCASHNRYVFARDYCGELLTA